jgi:hypothetical protein
MDISALAQAASKLAQAPEAAGALAPAAPLAAPDPAAVADFRAALHGPQAPEGAPAIRPAGEAQAPARAEAPGADPTIASLLGQDDLAHADLFRIQVAACMASFEAQRNTSVVSAMNQGLGTLVKSAE